MRCLAVRPVFCVPVSYVIAGVALAAALPAFSQDPRYVNKLAPFVASPDHIVDVMLDLAKIKPGETVYDLGCGDGRILVPVVERYKAKAVGIEISPKLVQEAEARIQKAGVSDRAHVIKGDVLAADLSGADVAIIYLSTELNKELRPRLERYLKPGSRVVSHDYAIPGWKPTLAEHVDGKQNHLVFLYEMPPTKQ